MKTGHSAGLPTISCLTATCIVIANMVGTGVFTSLGFQVGDLPSGFAIVALWVTGGVCAFCGAAAYGELAAALPRSGGEYHLLGEIYHPAVGFMAGWLSATVGFAAPIALAAMAFGKYFAGIFPSAAPVPVSLAVVALVTLVHLRGIGLGSAFQTAATIFKLLLILALLTAGFAMRTPQPISFFPVPGDGALMTSGPFAVSLIYVMYAYSGWNASTYIAGEVRHPARNVPLSLALGTLVVLALYVALNATFLRAAPLAELRGQLEVGHVAAAHIFGAKGGRFMAGLICAGLVSSISAMTWIGPRVAMTMGEDHRALRIFARKSADGVPVRAMLAQWGIVATLLLTTAFEKVLTYVQFSLTLCAMLTVLGVFVLRVRRPDLARPYRAWGYPATPLIFLAISAWMLCHILRANPWESLAGLGTIFAGLLVYFISPTRRAFPEMTTPSLP